jgi:hypothetical protein
MRCLTAGHATVAVLLAIMLVHLSAARYRRRGLQFRDLPRTVKALMRKEPVAREGFGRVEYLKQYIAVTFDALFQARKPLLQSQIDFEWTLQLALAFERIMAKFIGCDDSFYAQAFV